MFIVIGGGHAGIEAAFAASKKNARTLLVTISVDRLGEMSCNPSIGGQAKGQLVREVDILGGVMGRAADFAAIQYRILNRRKGPAVQALRAQCDKNLYRTFMHDFLFNVPNLTLFQGEVVALESRGVRNFVVKTKDGSSFESKAVVITSGTFLNGLVHIGADNFSSGRLGEPASMKLSAFLVELGHKKFRLKTGTPVRLLGRSIDFSRMEVQPGEYDYTPFSVLTEGWRPTSSTSSSLSIRTMRLSLMA